MSEQQRPVKVGMSPEASTALTPLAMPLLLSEDKLPSGAPPETDALVCSFVRQYLGEGDVVAILRKRYNDLSGCASEPLILPLFQNVMSDVVRPLVEAKRCYVLGMPVSCIAQSGLVGEMVALWRFEMLEPKLAGRELGDDVQKLLLGTTFEKLGQERRVKVLRALRDLDEPLVDSFGQLRQVRRKYLHFPLEDAKRVDADARKAYKHACRLVKGTMGLTITEDGQSTIPPGVHSWLLRLPEKLQKEGKAKEQKK